MARGRKRLKKKRGEDVTRKGGETPEAPKQMTLGEAANPATEKQGAEYVATKPAAETTAANPEVPATPLEKAVEPGAKTKAKKPRRPCGGTRPGTKKGEKNIKTQTWTVDQIGDIPVGIMFYAGCVEGEKGAYTLKGDARYVLAEGTVKDIVNYTIGRAVTIGKRGEFKRNIGRRSKLATDTVRYEVTGEGGEVARIIRERGGRHNGYTVTVDQIDDDGNRTSIRVTDGSKINQYFRERTLTKGGKSRTFMGGVELTVSAVIIDGAEDSIGGLCLNNKNVGYDA